MEVFYSRSFEGGLCTLDPEESGHCVRVLRHREGDEIFVIDGEGTLYTCVLTDASPKGAVARGGCFALRGPSLTGGERWRGALVLPGLGPPP